MKYLKRLAESKVREYSSFFKVVAILGARQVGKSSLLKNMFPDYKYITFDPLQDFYGARKDPDLFLQNFKPPLILDEIQYVPELIPALKRFSDQNDKSGQYFITGSQNLPVLKNISESLAGRVGIINLYSMTGSEMSEEIPRNGNWLENLLFNHKNPDSFQLFSYSGTLAEFLWKGTMPGLLEASESIIPAYFESYVLTYLERDVRMMEDIKNFSDFSRFIRICAVLNAQEINSSHLGREIGITPQTARRWLDLLLHSFQWIEVEPYIGNTIKRISGKKKGYISDTGIGAYLMRISSPEVLLTSPYFGAYFESFAVNSIIKLVSTLKNKPGIYHWRTSAGAEVDIVLEYNETLYPIEIKAKTNITKQDARGISSFFETYPGKSRLGLIIYAGNEVYQVKENIWAVPWNLI